MKCMPMLLYRQSRKPWRAVVDLWQIVNVTNGMQYNIDDNHLVDIGFETACYLIR